MVLNGRLKNKIYRPTLRMVADLRNGDAIHRPKYPKISSLPNKLSNHFKRSSTILKRFIPAPSRLLSLRDTEYFHNSLRCITIPFIPGSYLF